MKADDAIARQDDRADVRGPVARAGYSGTQIALHWIIAALIVAQVLLHEGMEVAYRFEQGGPAPTESESLLATVHIGCGIAVFVLALLRIVIRVRRGAPPPPEQEHQALRLVAQATHFAFYGVILLMPLTGALAWFGAVDAAASIHGIGLPVILGLVFLHIVGALYHHFILKTDVLRRMLRPER